MEIDIGGKKVTLHMQEVAEAKTMDEYINDSDGKSLGLYGALNHQMMSHLVKEDKLPHIHIGEANLQSQHLGAVRNALNQGRKCGTLDEEIREKLGLLSVRALHADFVVFGSDKIGTAAGLNDTLPDTIGNSFLVTYMPRDMLRMNYSSLTNATPLAS